MRLTSPAVAAGTAARRIVEICTFAVVKTSKVRSLASADKMREITWCTRVAEIQLKRSMDPSAYHLVRARTGFEERPADETHPLVVVENLALLLEHAVAVTLAAVPLTVGVLAQFSRLLVRVVLFDDVDDLAVVGFDWSFPAFRAVQRSQNGEQG